VIVSLLMKKIENNIKIGNRKTNINTKWCYPKLGWGQAAVGKVTHGVYNLIQFPILIYQSLFSKQQA
jgi:hypothetical protein